MKVSTELRALKETCEMVGLPQTATAKHLGISAAYLNRIYSGALAPSDELLFRAVDLTERLKKTGLIAV